MTAAGRSEPITIGRYEISSVLGMGGFAAVHRAHDPALDADVAIKVLLSQFVDNEDIRNRFEQEARLLRRVDSPHLIRVYDVGEFDGNRPYFVMELAEGGVLSERIDGPIDQESMLKVVDALAGGLGALHDNNIVHRDIKPDNLLITGGVQTTAEGARFEKTEISSALLTEGERLVVGDLGLAKDHDRTSVGPTVAGGTPFYRSPEQMTTGAAITAAADIYAATGVMWFLLAGNHPPQTDAVPTQLPGMPRAWQAFLERGLNPDPELRHGTIEAWANEAHQAVADGLTSLSAIGTTDNLCPYKGMAAFQPEDSGLFFGRDDMIDSLVTKLQTNPVLVIGGPSGSGKSSVMRAGLIPRLARGAIPGSQQWRMALFTPGSDAIGELVYQLRRIRSAGNHSDLSASGEQLTRQDLPHGARRWLEATDDAGVGAPQGTVLAIDQFEELFTLNPTRADQELFLETLAAMTESEHSRVKVVLALRADFYGVCAGHPWLNDRINENQLLVGPMSRHELRDAITIPATRAGLRLEDGLADEILDDIGPGGGALPLLGHALMETWIRRRGTTMTIDGYHAAGGVSGAIAQRAEEIFTALTPTEQQAGRRLLLQLINPGEGTPDTRRRLSCDELPTDAGFISVLEKLAAGRLLTVDEFAADLAHEALIHTWPRLRAWIDEDRESLQTRRRIGAAAAEWEAEDRNPDLLYRGTQLAAALEYEAANPQELGHEASDFLRTARDARDQAERERAEAEARSRRNRRLAVSALAVLATAAVIASIGALLALRTSQSNERAAEASQVQALAAAASAAAADQPLVATELALEALARATPSTAQARGSLVDARVALHENRWLPQPFGDPIAVRDMLALAMTPDGRLFVTGSRSGDVVFWDRVSRTEFHRLDRLHFKGVSALRMSDDGRWMVSAGGATAVLWDLSGDVPEATPLFQFESPSQIIWDVMISPDNSKVALTTESAGVPIIDLETGTVLATGLEGDASDLLSGAFLTDDRLVIGDGLGIARVLDATSGQQIGDDVIAGDGGNDVWELVVDRATGTLLSVSRDNTVRSWSFADDVLTQLQVTKDDALGRPTDVEMIRDGAELVIGAADGRVYRADAVTGELIVDGRTSAVHTDDVIALAASDNDWMVSLADDQRVQVWQYVGDDAAIDQTIVSGPPIHDLALALDPSGARLAATGPEGTVVYDAESGAVLAELNGGGESVAFAGTDLITTGSAVGAVQLWNAETGALLAQADAHASGPIRSIGAGPDGDLVATGGQDGTVVLWSIDGEQLDQRWTVDMNAGEVTDLVFTPDGDTVIALGFLQRLMFIDASNGDTRTIELSMDGPQALAVHPTRDLVAIGESFENVDVIDFDGNLVSTMAPHPGGAWDLAFTADGLSLVAASRGPGLVQLWDWETSIRLGPAFGTDSEREEPDVVTAPDGTVWTSGDDGTIRRLDVLVRAVGCELSANVMDQLMQQRFLGEETMVSCDSAPDSGT